MCKQELHYEPVTVTLHDDMGDVATAFLNHITNTT